MCKSHWRVSVLSIAIISLILAGCSSSQGDSALASTSEEGSSTTVSVTTTTLPMTCEERGLDSIENMLERLEADREREMRSESRWDDPDVAYILQDVFPLDAESLQKGEVACRVEADARIQDGDFRDTASVSMVFCMDSENSFMGGFVGTEMLAKLDECLVSLRGALPAPDFTVLSEELQQQIVDYTYYWLNRDISSCEEATDVLSKSGLTALYYTRQKECQNIIIDGCIKADRLAKAIKEETSVISPEYKYYRDHREVVCYSTGGCYVLAILEDAPDRKTRDIIQDAKDTLFAETGIEC